MEQTESPRRSVSNLGSRGIRVFLFVCSSTLFSISRLHRAPQVLQEQHAESKNKQIKVCQASTRFITTYPDSLSFSLMQYFVFNLWALRSFRTVVIKPNVSMLHRRGALMTLTPFAQLAFCPPRLLTVVPQTPLCHLIVILWMVWVNYRTFTIQGF